MRLTHVDKVEFQDHWDDSHLQSIDWSKIPRDLHLFSSPLARIWSPFHLEPGSKIFDAPITVEFDNVIKAFSLTRKPLRLLDTSGSLAAYEIFHSKSLLSRAFRQHSLSAMYCLESLSMIVDMRHFSQSGLVEIFEDPKQKTLSVDLLAVALRYMPGLRSLALNVSITDPGNGLISMNDLFLKLCDGITTANRAGPSWMLQGFRRYYHRKFYTISTNPVGFLIAWSPQIVQDLHSRLEVSNTFFTVVPHAS